MKTLPLLLGSISHVQHFRPPKNDCSTASTSRSHSAPLEGAKRIARMPKTSDEGEVRIFDPFHLDSKAFAVLPKESLGFRTKRGKKDMRKNALREECIFRRGGEVQNEVAPCRYEKRTNNSNRSSSGVDGNRRKRSHCQANE